MVNLVYLGILAMSLTSVIGSPVKGPDNSLPWLSKRDGQGDILEEWKKLGNPLPDDCEKWYDEEVSEETQKWHRQGHCSIRWCLTMNIVIQFGDHWELHKEEHKKSYCDELRKEFSAFVQKKQLENGNGQAEIAATEQNANSQEPAVAAGQQSSFSDSIVNGVANNADKVGAAAAVGIGAPVLWGVNQMFNSDPAYSQ